MPPGAAPGWVAGVTIKAHPLEAALTRYGYNARVLAELLNVRSAVVRAFLHGQLTHGRTQDLHAQLLAAGLPV